MSDSCLTFKRISAEIDGARIEDGEVSWEDEETGNQYDTDQTVNEILAHNEVYDRICPNDDRN